MKIIYQVLLGILVAVALSFVIVSFGTVQPVIKQPTVITPVPTPLVVYVTAQPTLQQGQQEQLVQSEWGTTIEQDEELTHEVSSIISIAIIGVGVIPIILWLFSFREFFRD